MRHGWKQSEEAKAKMRRSKLGPLNPNYGKHLSVEARKHLSTFKHFKGKHHTIEAKEKMRLAKIGFHHTPASCAKMSKSKIGHTVSKSTREKIAMSMKGKNAGKYNGGNTGMKMSSDFCENQRQVMKKVWTERRQQRLNAKPHYLQRQLGHKEHIHKFKFTELDKRLWLADHCAYCGTMNRLTLDHIIPRYAGGTNVQPNAQTLCKSCNTWKHNYVDTPLWFAMKNKLRIKITSPRPIKPGIRRTHI